VRLSICDRAISCCCRGRYGSDLRAVMRRCIAAGATAMASLRPCKCTSSRRDGAQQLRDFAADRLRPKIGSVAGVRSRWGNLRTRCRYRGAGADAAPGRPVTAPAPSELALPSPCDVQRSVVNFSNAAVAADGLRRPCSRSRPPCSRSARS